jgi:hypothetical protein
MAGEKDSPQLSAGGRGRSGAPRRKRPGLPDKSLIISVRTLTSPKGNRYRIIETKSSMPTKFPRVMSLLAGSLGPKHENIML